MSYRALDLRFGAELGVKLAQIFRPYALARVFGGPVFSIYKALSAVKLAQEARKLGVDTVPVFWLATEDHDFEEVNQVRGKVLPGRRRQRTTAGDAKCATNASECATT